MKKITFLLTGIVFTVLLSFNAKAQHTKLYDFIGTTNGTYPGGALISDGTFLYGIAASGGTNASGVLFKIKPDGTGYAKVLDFASVNLNSPLGSLTFDGTFLYGTTGGGGTNGAGVFFKIKPDGTGYSSMYNFGGTAGLGPIGGFISDGTFLYGMTNGSGISYKGIIFKIKLDGTGYTKLLDFTGTNGSTPYGTLISDGTFLYGMTSMGGTNDLGVVFKIKPDGTGYAKLLDFAGSVNGSYPRASLISDGTFLYGLTTLGGTNNKGVLFRIKSDGTAYAKLIDFAGTTNGSEPENTLVSNGSLLYGMTTYGGTGSCGSGGCGTIFKIKSDGTGFSKLFDFNWSGDGRTPTRSLLLSGSFLYGVTQYGGSDDYGTIFKFGLPVGIDENKKAIDLNIYPNPSNGIITVETDELQGTQGQLEIYNVIGEKIYESAISQNNNSTIDISSQPNGIYFMQLKTEKGIASKKIIISK